MKAQIIEDRLLKLQGLSLKHGSHSPDSTFCVMEAVAFVAGEKWSDAPECACPVISAFLRSWNDSLPSDAERDRLLKPLIPKIVNTRNKSLELKRSLMAADWLIRVHTPEWLRLAGLVKQAEVLESLPEIIAMAQFPSIRGPIEAVRIDADAAWDAARAAGAARDATRVAGDAAGAATRAAWDAARAAWDAAWAAGDAAGAATRAAWDAARAAGAARDATRVAGDAAGDKLAPTVSRLQDSALLLVNRMIDLGRDN